MGTAINSTQPAENGIQWRPEFRPCPVCNSDRRKTIGARGGAAQRDGKGIETSIVACAACGVLYAFPTLVPLSNPYAAPDEYFAAHDRQDKIRIGRNIAAEAESILNRTGRMLELGCGRGELLIGAKQRGWQVHGVEMTEEFADIAAAAGVEIERAAIEECESLNASDRFDVILLAAVLEHLYTPADVLCRARHALRPGGLLFVDVPNERSLAMRAGNLYMRLRRRKWSINLSPTFPPFHVVGFSPASLKKTLVACGFDLHKMKTVRYTFELAAGTEQTAMRVLQSLGQRLSMGDGIICWARRRVTPPINS